MWILQEYRFYLIIAVIALVGILILFFNTQQSQELTEFNTNLKSNFAQIKGQASEGKSMYDVVTIDGTNFRGMKNNQLFGLTLDATSIAPTGILLAKSASVFPTPSAGKFTIGFVDTDIDDTTTPGANGVTGQEAMDATDTTLKGWNISYNGKIVFVFTDETVAKKVMVDFLPEGTLVEWATTGVKNIVEVPFITR